MANLIICLPRRTFNLPFFIAPAANAGLAHHRGELNLVEAAGRKGGILYALSLSATQPIEEIARHAQPQVLFHQL